MRIPTPLRNAKSGIWYYRARIPDDVLHIVAGQTLLLEVAGHLVRLKLVTTVKISLRTTSESEARARHASVANQVQKRWSLARQSAPKILTQQEIVGLSGLLYREMISNNEAEPGDPFSWDVYREPIIDALNLIDEPDEGVPPRSQHDPALGFRKLEKLFNIDDFLARQSLNIDRPSRVELLQDIARTMLGAAALLQRRSLGDYGPDTYALRFPAVTAPTALPASTGVTLWELYDGWVKESLPLQTTKEQWRRYIEIFADFLGHCDASRVTKADVLKWKESLIELGNSAKTIRDSKLAALRKLYKWGLENDRVNFDPTLGIKVRRNKKPGQQMRGFSLHEASIILKAASSSDDPACRWVPILCAQSGARAGEICQLRSEDIGLEDGIWYMDIRAEAGSVKNARSERRVPLHPEVIKSGFLSFVEEKRGGPLFYDPHKIRRGVKRPPAKMVRQKVAKWVHTLGLKVGMEHRKAPNHAWRHLFTSRAKEAGISDSVIEAIGGWTPVSEGGRYGKTSLKTMQSAIEKIELPGMKAAHVSETSSLVVHKSGAPSVHS